MREELADRLSERLAGLIKYQVVCDSTNNTPDVVARNELRARITITHPTADEIERVVSDVVSSLEVCDCAQCYETDGHDRCRNCGGVYLQNLLEDE